MQGRVVTTFPELQAALSFCTGSRLIAVDVETYKTRPTQPGALLLGVSCTYLADSGEHVSFYVPIHHYDKIQKRFKKPATEECVAHLTKFLRENNGYFIGWNAPFDKAWIDATLGLDTKWFADGRIYWHLQNNDVAVRGFGLKKAQSYLLGWSETNEKALEEHVKAAGGSLKEGHHYLADLDILAHYACLDTLSTFLAYKKLEPWVSERNYKWFADRVLDFSIKLHVSGASGLPVDVTMLREAQQAFKQRRQEAAIRLREVCAREIDAIEEGWKVTDAARRKSPRGRDAFMEDKRRHRRFNPSSGHQRALLLHQILKYPILDRTPTGIPKTDRASISAIKHPSAAALIEYSENKKLAEAASTYLEYTEQGRLYTNYDVCGTVSGRLSGFKPSVLNMPFSEMELMRAFKCEEGFVGIHADLASIEPCVLAHYSEDPTLMKVYKEGKGDIYLDLALDVFPGDTDLRNGYNPNDAPSSEVKSKYKDVRNICKIIHLAVSYTGTHITIAKNLTKSGYPTSKGAAMQLVARYWQKFARVRDFSYRLGQHYDSVGEIRNIIGRVVQVPEIYKKDLLNRLIQSSAHDILVLWVEEIIKRFNNAGIEWKYWLPDIHDSTTFMVRAHDAERAQKIYTEALQHVETQLELLVPLRAEAKICTTLAGLKGE